MYVFLSRFLNKFFPHLMKCEARRREARYAEREARRRQARHVRLSLEGLEDRIVPSAYIWTGVDNNNDYNDKENWNLSTNNQVHNVPGAMDTAFIPASTPVCNLNGTLQQTVAGLTVAGTMNVGTGSNSSKLSVTTASMASGGVFNIGANGEVDVLGSADLGGSGTINGHLDDQGASVTFDPSSNMTLGIGAQLTGSLYNVFGPLTVAAALNLSAQMVLDNNGNSTAGSLTGPGSLDDSSEFDWDGGAFGLAGGASFSPTADLKLQSAEAKLLSAGILTDQCNASELGGTADLTIDSGAVFENYGNPSTSLTLPSISGLGTFVNDADGFLDVQGSTPTRIYCNFTNNGTLDVANGSTLTLVNLMDGTVNLDGTLRLDGDLLLQGSMASPTGLNVGPGLGHLNIGDNGVGASLNVPSGVTDDVLGFVEVSSGGKLSGSGQVYTNGTVEVDLGGTASIGSFQMGSSGTLELHAASAGMFGGGTNSALTVAGSAELSGVLQLDFDGGYVPTSGTSFTVLTAGLIDAHFDTTPPDMTVGYTPISASVTQN